MEEKIQTNKIREQYEEKMLELRNKVRVLLLRFTAQWMPRVGDKMKTFQKRLCCEYSILKICTLKLSVL